MRLHSIFVSHTAQIAHRLSQLPGKCQKIHGHTFHIELQLTGMLDDNGILASIDFGTLKQIFRSYIDREWDHRLHLNEKDEWAGDLTITDPSGTSWMTKLPGLRAWSDDPTTENCAMWIGEYMRKEVNVPGITAVKVSIQETDTNGATWEWHRED